jgi:hypothetical protein
LHSVYHLFKGIEALLRHRGRDFVEILRFAKQRLAVLFPALRFGFLDAV